MFKVILLLLFVVKKFFSLEVFNQKLFENLLSNAKIYIDKNNTGRIRLIKEFLMEKIELKKEEKK